MTFNKTSLSAIIYFFLSFFLLELISFCAFLYPNFLPYIFTLIVVLFLFLCFYRLKYGLFLVLLELIIGSKGYLLYLPLQNGNLLSLRIVIWSLFILVFAFYFLKQIQQEGKRAVYWQNIKNFFLLKPFLVLAGVLVLGLVSALIYQNEWLNIFSDFNNWLYFLILFPILALKPKRRELAKILIIGSSWIALKTLVLLFIFSHNIFIADQFYKWLRTTLVGEMTILDGWNRIFIQSQNFVATAYLFFLAFSHKLSWRFKKNNLSTYFVLFLGGLFFSAIILSLSRSFWLGLIVVIFLFLGFFLLKKEKEKLKKTLYFLFTTILIAIFLIFLTIPQGAQKQLDNQIISRVAKQEESAIASRWSLLSPLFTEILKNPLTGQGFGSTVTYFSQDPRILQTEPSGLYTTYAFEWGYLDIWLKIGILGLAAYLFILYLLLKHSFLNFLADKDYFYLGLASSIVFLIVVHFFTPYLNHPLGIGLIVASSCLIYKNQVY